MTPEGAALHPSQLQFGQVTSCNPGTILQTQPYPQYVYQLIGAPQIQPAQYSVIGFQPIFPLNQQITVQNSANLQQTPVIPAYPALQAVPVQNLPKVPDFESSATQDNTIQPKISSFFNEVKNNVQLIAPKPGIQSSNCTETYSKQKKKREDSKSKRQMNRFNGMSEEEIAKKGLPDYLKENLDIVFIGINPSMHAAWTGKYYDGPGNHFWQCLHLSGIVPDNMTAADDFKLLNYGIGFTNVVARTTRGLSDLTKQEIAEGAVKLREKLAYWKPKIAVFNGKIIYEVYAKQKKFHYGRQPDRMPGTDIVQWVMPSSSARCALLPRASDKVPFYQALKKYSDYIKGMIPEPDESEVVFNHIHSNRLSPKKFKEEFVLKQDMNETSIVCPPNEDSSEPELSKLEPEESQMPKLEPQVPWPINNSHGELKQKLEKLENNQSKLVTPVEPNKSSDMPISVKQKEKDGPLKYSDMVVNDNSCHAFTKTSLTSSDESDFNDEINTISKQVVEDDSDSEMFLSNNKGTNSECAADIFERLLNAPSKKYAKSPKPSKESPAKELNSSKKKRGVHETWQSSVPKRNKNSPTSRGDTLNVQCAPWGGESISTFDLSEDYVNDYLKEKAKATISTKCEEEEDSLKPSGLLMISPRPSETGRKRSGSLDLIPACVPESVGTEIEDIIQSGFTNERSYNIDSELSSELSAQPNISPPLPSANKPKKKKGAKKSNSGRSSPQKGKDRKNPRTKSTDDLPPNMLPEDYLDEVIGQYFNNDSSSEEEPRVTDKILKKKIVPVSNIISENSSDEDEDLEINKARTRPPASFFSMDFLDDAELSDAMIQNENPPKEKIKTDLEIEAEYKHILYGGKKRKAPKIGAGKKRKKASSYKFPGEKTKKVVKAVQLNQKIQPSKGKPVPNIKKFVLKIGTTNKKEIRPKPNPSPFKETKQSLTKKAKAKHTPTKSVKPSPQKEINIKASLFKTTETKNYQAKKHSNVEEVLPEPHLTKKPPVQKPCAKSPIAAATGEAVTHSWKGKKASKRAYDRSKMFQKVKRPDISSKIEDVTGRYSQEEELVTCGICELLDPPFDPENPQFAEETTEWVGCDCYRWFHKCCTKLMKITEKFSCKSVKMKCIEHKPEPTPVKPVLQIAILKFFRDRDITLIEDVLW